MDIPSHLNAQLILSAAQLTDAGLKDVNEDCIGIAIPQGQELVMKGAVAVIADGVSTAEAGKEASETCVQNFLSDYYSTPDSWSVATAGQKILTALNRWLYGQGQHYIDAHKGYISTLSALIIKSNSAYIFHVGDSRIYLLRDGSLEQLTNDHCARISGQSAYLTRAMGMDVRLEVDYRSIEVREGDIFFLSSDGVHDYISRRELEQALCLALQPSASFETICKDLQQQALANGSEDNLSCQLLRIDSLPVPEMAEACESLSQLPFPPDLAPGQKVGGYEVEALLYASNRSQLYKVSDIATGGIYAMKTPSVNFEDDPAYIERFVMEPWVGSRIESPHVVGVAEPAKKPQFLYYLTHYVEGPTLTEWMQYHPQPDPKRVVELAGQMVKGVRAFHRREVLHQDLKPDNVVVDAYGIAKIIDFGSCYITGVHEISVSIERDKILGTAHYSAPELILTGQGSVLSDQFSIGCMVYEMLTGKLPYGERYGDLHRSIDLNKLEYVPSYHHNPHVPLWLDGAIRKATKLNPQQRYEVLSEFVFDLNHPNPKFLGSQHVPLIERNPLRLWQGISLCLLVLQLVTIYLWLA